MTFLWILVAMLYVVCCTYFGPGDVPQRGLLAVLDRFPLPILWIIGPFIVPTESAAAAA
jgi:hypothetical protein